MIWPLRLLLRTFTIVLWMKTHMMGLKNNYTWSSPARIPLYSIKRELQAAVHLNHSRSLLGLHELKSRKSVYSSLTMKDPSSPNSEIKVYTVYKFNVNKMLWTSNDILLFLNALNYSTNYAFLLLVRESLWSNRKL